MRAESIQATLNHTPLEIEALVYFIKEYSRRDDDLIDNLAHCFSALYMNMAERINKQDHSFIQLHKDIAVSLNENKGLEEAMRYSVQRVCEETGWPVGHIYFPASETGGGLVPSPIWFFEDAGKFEHFRKVTEATPLAWGEGLPGRALAKGKPSWIMDVTKDPNT